jgi:hypothetical protein
VSALDGVTMPWDNRIFCCLGEILQDTMMKVAIPATAFELTANTWVYTEETLAEQLMAVPHPQLLPRIAAAAVNPVGLRTWYLMYLPSKYASLLLSNKGCEVQEVYQMLLAMFQADNFLAGTTPILTWLTVSMHATHINNTGPPATSLAITAPFVDDDLMQHRTPLINRMLPNQNAPKMGLEATIIQMATAMVNQATKDQTSRIAREIERDTFTTPATKFGLLIDSLKLFLNVQEEADLPKFCFQFTAAQKKQEFSVCLPYHRPGSHTQVAFRFIYDLICVRSSR